MSSITMSCPSCGRVYTPDLCNREEFEKEYTEWMVHREVIQRVWPYATPIQREQLKTGICSDECWNKYLGVEEE